MVSIVSLSIDLSVSEINIIIDMYIGVLTHIYLINHVDIKIVLNVFYIL